jgi:hypothetical protein
MADAIRVVSSRTIIKKITVGVPVPSATKIEIFTSVGKLLDVLGDPELGDLLIYNPAAAKWETSNLLENQTIEGGEGF